ncbi:MAG: adenosine kinase [Pseudomonadota bacterium]
MATERYDVVGIGNAIVDVIGQCDDAFLETHGAPKGHMRLVDADEVAALYDAMGPATEISGGSAANTIAGVASFGGSTAYIGKVADDAFGEIFAHDLRAIGVHFDTAPGTTGTPTARSLVLVTPDGERTMNTFLGISPELGDAELDANLIENAKIVYLEGYLFDRPEAKAAFYKATDIAKGAGARVALTLSDAFCVDRHRDDFLTLIKDRVNILFANESELASLAQTEDFMTAIDQVAPHVSVLAATQSEKGSILIGETRHTIAALPVATVTDTTGAGDLYAAGVLFGLANDLGLEQAGKLGSLAASEVISHLGARPAVSLRDLAHNRDLL